MNKFSKKIAFTLAELLIVIAILGVVADAAIPDLIKDFRDKDTVQRLKKAYSTMDTAYKMLKNRSLDMDTVFAGSDASGGSSNVMNTFSSVLSVAMKCGDTGVACFPSTNYKWLDGTNPFNINTNSDGPIRSKAILNDGLNIAIDDYTQNGCTNDSGSSVFDYTCGDVLVDTNGFSGPNQWGRDLFKFFITRDGVYPAGHPSETAHTITTCTTAGSGTGCAAKVLRDNEILY